MPIQFTCPHCGLQTSVADENAGQSGPCAGCGKTISVSPPGSGQVHQAPPRRSRGPTASCIVLVVVIVFAPFVAMLLGLLLPAVQAAREAARRATCIKHLKQLGVAMHNYHDAHGCFPPAYLADKDGKPMHSWRVLILPSLEESFLYDQYDFDQPWDSPHNLALAAKMPDIYRCPSSSDADSTETCYMMIVGPGRISDGRGASSFKDITDGTANTMMLFEVDPSVTSANWMEPRDLDADQISYVVNDGSSPGIGSQHDGTANALSCDGAVHVIDKKDARWIREMSTIAGGEPIGEFFDESYITP